MNYIISFDIASLVILLIFLVYMLAQRQTRDRANLILLQLVVVCIVATIGEIVFATLVSSDLTGEPYRTIASIAKYIYFFFHNMVFGFYVLYTYTSFDVWHKYKNNRKLVRFWRVLILIAEGTLLTNIPIKSVFRIDENLIYHRGILIIIFYIIGFTYAIWTFLVIWKYRSMVNMAKRITLFLLYPIVTTSIVIQMFMPKYRVNLFGLALAVMLFMLVVQRQDYRKDPVTGAINFNTGVDRIKSIFIMGKPVTITLIKLVNHSNLQMYLGQEKFGIFLRLMTARLTDIALKHNYPVDVYYLGYGLYAFMSEEYDINSAIPVADDIKESLSEEMTVGDFVVRTDARICIVRCPDDVDEFSTLYTLMTTFHDTMLSKVSNTDPSDEGAAAFDNRDVILYAEHKDDREFMIRNEMSDIIDRALRDGSLKMYYQPIFSTIENRFVSAEALIRLHDEKYGDISPAIFIPMAEANGAIHAIGDFVLQSVLDFISRIDLDRLGLRYVEFNLSASQCIEVDLVDKIMNLIEERGIKPGNISLELTENAADINPAIVDANVWKLHDAGIRFALDDYGTGYSNIKRVTALPVEQVKLDKSFVDEIDNPQMWIVIEDTIAMLKEMGKEILIEGVETEATAAKLSEIDADLLQGCELMQGFLFCKPLPEEEFVEFIKGRL